MNLKNSMMDNTFDYNWQEFDNWMSEEFKSLEEPP